MSEQVFIKLPEKVDQPYLFHVDEDFMLDTNDVVESDPLEIKTHHPTSLDPGGSSRLARENPGSSSTKTYRQKTHVTERKRSARLIKKAQNKGENSEIINISMAKKKKNTSVKLKPNFICTQCGEEFKRSNKLKKHLEKHHWFECNMCEYTNTNYDEIFHHVTTHTGHIDINTIRDKNELKSKTFETNIETKKPAFGCVICEYKKSNGQPEFKCNLCKSKSSYQGSEQSVTRPKGPTSKGQDQFEQVAELEQLTELEQIPESKQHTEVIIDNILLVEKVPITKLLVRMEQVNKNNVNIKQKKAIKNKQITKMEQKRQNTLDDAEFEPPIWIDGTLNKCNKCECVFKKRDMFILHWWLHCMRHLNKSFLQCKMCGAKFEEHNFKRHIMMHDVFEKHECNKCEYKTLFELNFNQHLKLH